MIKGLFAFFFIFTVFFCGISYVWYLTRREKIEYIRLAVYSLVCALLTLFFLVAIVVLF